VTRRRPPNDTPAAAFASSNADCGDRVWFTRPSDRRAHALTLIDHGVICACSSGAVVVQTRSTNNGPTFHIVPRAALHSLAGQGSNREPGKVMPPASADRAKPINTEE
jgi:hypothetical protein